MRKLFVIFMVTTLFCAYAAASGVDEATKKAFNAAKTQRVAVIALGDSNQKFGGHGWTLFMDKNLTKAYGGYATPIVPYGDSVRDKTEKAELPQIFKDKTLKAWYLPDGKTVKSSWTIGSLFIKKDDPMDVTGPLTFHLQIGTFDSDQGSFRPAMRLNEGPWKLLGQAEKAMNTQGESGGLKWVEFSVTSDPKRNVPLMFSTSQVNGPIKGPFLGSMLSCENTSKITGISYHTIYAAGGHSLFDMLSWAKKTGPKKLGNYMEAVKKLVRDNGSVIVMIHSGMNDRNERSTSVGPEGGKKGDSPEAYYDNLKGLTIEFSNAWKECGGDPAKLFFCFMPSHPLSDPDDKELTSYRAQAVKLAAEMNDQAGVILLPEIVSYSTMAENKYYDKGTKSNAHLSILGYDSISSAVVRALQQ